MKDGRKYSVSNEGRKDERTDERKAGRQAGRRACGDGGKWW